MLKLVIRCLLFVYQYTYENNDYSFLNDIITDANNYKFVNKEYLLTALTNDLIQNNFYLPNFGDSLSMTAWHYCHNVATFSNSNNLKETFFKVLLKEYDSHKNEESALSKIKSIVIYRFGISDFNEYFKK